MKVEVSGEDAFESIIAAVHARAAWEKAELIVPDTDDAWSHPAFQHARRLAAIAAELAIAPFRVSELLIDIECLALEYGSVIAQRQEEAAARALMAERTAIAQRGDWALLGFPTPKALCAALLAGEMVMVADHGIHYTRSLEVTWYSNPYGIDGVLGPQPTEESVRAFLLDMAQGEIYGAVPE